MLVGLDTDTFQGHKHIIPGQQFRIGISLLDTRALQDLLVALPAAEPARAIDSYQFTVGVPRYCRRAASKFLFGKSESILLSELKSRLEALVSTSDTVLVLHGANSDLKVLHSLGIDLGSLYIIDTNKAAQFPLQLHYRYSLEKLLDALKVPYAALHAAGSDARFRLRALLMIAVKDAERRPHAFREDLVRIFRAVAQHPRPLTAAEIQARGREGSSVEGGEEGKAGGQD